MLTLHDIDIGELFIWDKQPNEVYRLINMSEDGNRACVRCVLWRTNEGTWIPASRHDENFNAYAYVRKVAVSIDVE